MEEKKINANLKVYAQLKTNNKQINMFILLSKRKKNKHIFGRPKPENYCRFLGCGDLVIDNRELNSSP